MRPLRVLIIEDSEDDARSVEGELELVGFAVTSRRVRGPDELRRALDDATWDLAISRYATRRMTAIEAIELVHASAQPELPFLIVAGGIGGEIVEAALKNARLRREREETFAALERAVSARDEFLSIASHELKTPLTSLRLQAQSLARAARRERGPALANPQILRRIEAMERSAERLTTLIERLLDITRVATGALRLSRDRVDLVEIVRRVVDRMADTFRDARCEVSIAAPEHLVGEWDGDRLDTVLTSLLSNAAKYGACRPIRVELDEADDAARIHVVDRGIGVSAEDQRRIFERFERAVPERHYGGFGVGLWLAQQIAEAHGGHIDVESNAGGGSTFSVTLPKEVAAA